MAIPQGPLRYTPDHIDGLVRAATAHRQITMKHQEETQRVQAQQQNADRAAKLANVEHEGFCVKCRDKRTVVTAGEATHSNGMKSIHGACPECNTNVHRFIPKEKPEDGS